MIRNKEDFVTDEVIELIKKNERAAYPKSLWVWQNCNDIVNFVSACGCYGIEQIYCCVGENWHFLFADNGKKVTLIDFACASGECREIMSIISYAAKITRGRRVFLSAREKTSYRLICSMIKRNRIKVIMDKCYYNKGEFFHHMLIKPNKKYYKPSKLKNAEKNVTTNIKALKSKQK